MRCPHCDAKLDHVLVDAGVAVTWKIPTDGSTPSVTIFQSNEEFGSIECPECQGDIQESPVGQLALGVWIKAKLSDAPTEYD